MTYNLNTPFKDVLKVISIGVMAAITSVSGDVFSMDDREADDSSRRVLSSQAKTDAEFDDCALSGVTQDDFSRLPVINWTLEELKSPLFNETICHQANAAFVHQGQQTDYAKLREMEMIFSDAIRTEAAQSQLTELEQKIKDLRSKVGKRLAYRTWIRNMIPGVIALVKTKNRGPDIDRKIEETVIHFFRSVREIGSFEVFVDARDVLPGRDIIWKDYKKPK